MSLPGWEIPLKGSDVVESPRFRLCEITVLFSDAALWCSVAPSCCSAGASRSHLWSRSRRRKNGRRRDLVTPPIDLQRGFLVSVAPGSRANVKPPSHSSLLIHFMAPVPPLPPSLPSSLCLTCLFWPSYALLNFKILSWQVYLCK